MEEFEKWRGEKRTKEKEMNGTRKGTKKKKTQLKYDGGKAF